MTEPDKTNKTAIFFELDQALKAEYKTWCDANGFATVSEALRNHIRSCTRPNGRGQGVRQNG